MKIAGYLQTSLIEWPGKISSVIFVPGCNFRCPFCHNRDLVDAKNAEKLTKYRERAVLADLKKRKKWIDGVVITGGEPLLQADLSGFLSRCKRMGFETMIETNGSLHTILHSMISKSLVDFVTMDFKGPLNQQYLRIVGVKSSRCKVQNDSSKLKILENIKKSMKLILFSGLPFEFRTTVVPGIHDEEVLVDMARELKQLTINNQQLANLTWFLQNFQPKNCLDPEFNKKKPYDIKELREFLKAVKKIIPGVKLRGN